MSFSQRERESKENEVELEGVVVVHPKEQLLSCEIRGFDSAGGSFF